jgi:hypothetical protein
MSSGARLRLSEPESVTVNVCAIRAYNIYARTLERYTLLVMAKAHRTRSILLARQRSDNLQSTRMMRRTNKMIAPLFMLDE